MAEVERALALDPNNAFAYFSRGLIKRMLGKPAEAIADFDRSIAIAPSQSNVFAERGGTRIAMNQIDKALPDLDQALALDRNNDNARATRGLALLLKGNTTEGLPDLNNVLEQESDDQVALIGRGIAMITSGQFDRAIVALNQVVGKSADDTPARLIRARAYLAKGDASRRDAGSQHGPCHQTGGCAGIDHARYRMVGMKEYAKALEDLNQAIEKQETVEDYVARAGVYEAQNKIGKATADLQRATELTPKNVFEMLAQTSAKQKVQQFSKRIPCGSKSERDLFVRAPCGGGDARLKRDEFCSTAFSAGSFPLSHRGGLAGSAGPGAAVSR